jgi:simple sugar transport system permease protein
MTAAVTEPGRAEAVLDDRVATRSLVVRMLRRPEVGSLVGAIVIFALFMLVAVPFRNVANIGTILYGASTIGIMAVPVALLMIGGEFDLSAGVAVTTAGLSASLLAWNFGLNVWVGVILALALSLGVGAFNGWLLFKTGLPSFLVTLGTFFVLQGVNLGVTRLLTGNVATADISDMDGFTSAQAVFGSEIALGPVTLKVTVLYWVVPTAKIQLPTGSSRSAGTPRPRGRSASPYGRRRSACSWPWASAPGCPACTCCSSSTRSSRARASARSSSSSSPR